MIAAIYYIVMRDCAPLEAQVLHAPHTEVEIYHVEKTAAKRREQDQKHYF